MGYFRQIFASCFACILLSVPALGAPLGVCLRNILSELRGDNAIGKVEALYSSSPTQIRDRARLLWDWVKDRKKTVGKDPAGFIRPNWAPGGNRAVARSIYSRLRDANAFQEWIVKLYYECASEMEHAKDPKALLAFREGRMDEGSVIRVLLNRGKKHGWNRIVVLNKVATDSQFSGLLRSGDLFYDIPFDSAKEQGKTTSDSHGRDSHILQLLYLAEGIDSQYGHGTMRSSVIDMGTSDSGKSAWLQYLDNAGDNLSAPIFVHSVSNEFFGLR